METGSPVGRYLDENGFVYLGTAPLAPQAAAAEPEDEHAVLLRVAMLEASTARNSIRIQQLTGQFQSMYAESRQLKATVAAQQKQIDDLLQKMIALQQSQQTDAGAGDDEDK